MNCIGQTIIRPEAEDRTIIMFIRLNKTTELDGQTDRQTDRQLVAMTAVCMASNATAL